MQDEARLEVRIGRLALPNPVICGSGEPVMTEAGIRAALRAGAAGVIAKSVNEQPAAARQLDRADYAWLDRAGNLSPSPDRAGSFFCRSGLSPRDRKAWFRAIVAIDRDAAKESQFVAGSIVLGGADGAVELAQLARQSGLRVFELNVGAPHAAEAQPGAIGSETEPAHLRALVRRVRGALGEMNLWVKLTGLATNLPDLAQAAAEGGADAVVMMGRFLALLPDLDSLAPALGTSAAYGGPWALPIVCRYLALSRRKVGPKFPLLGTNGIRSGADLARMALAGAWAGEMLSLVMQEGFAGLTRIRHELSALLAAKNRSFASLIGVAADALGAYGDQPERPGRWRDFVPAETLSEAE